jgi:hypothetical protein
MLMQWRGETPLDLRRISNEATRNFRDTLVRLDNENKRVEQRKHEFPRLQFRRSALKVSDSGFHVSTEL